MKDIHTHLAPVLNLSEVSIEESFALACDYPLTKILLQDLTPEFWPVELPVNIEYLDVMIESKVSEKEFSLISELFNLLQGSPVLHA